MDSDAEFPQSRSPKLGEALELWEEAKRIQEYARQVSKNADKTLRDLEKVILDCMDAEGMALCGTPTRRFSIRNMPVAKKIEWEELYNYIVENHAFDLLHRRLSVSNLVDRLEAGEKVPGVSLGAISRLDITKR